MTRPRHRPDWEATTHGRRWEPPPASGPPAGRGWPPSGRPYGAPFWQRRFLRLAITVAAVWIGIGVVSAIVFGGGRHDADRDGSGGPVIPIIVAVAVAVTVVAYRRIARPVSKLLDGASRVGSGDYDARVQPDGPRSVRALGHAFNDMAARLDASEAARRRFLADVTHELRTPLTVLQGGVEAQLDGIHPRDDAHLGTLLEQTRTLARVVDDLRTLALGDAGRLTIVAQPAALDELIDDAVRAMRPMATARSVVVVVESAPPITLAVDRVRLLQVLTNLLTNAVRHTPAGGTVAVTLAGAGVGSGTEPGGGPGQTTSITVDDTGAGIDGDPERVFDRFYRTADSGGSGLGLTIARQLVEAHGGTIAASNRPEGGARFTVTLRGPPPTPTSS